MGEFSYGKYKRRKIPMITSKSHYMLEGLKEIAEYMGKHPWTIAKWITEGYFPAAKNKEGRWFISTSLIDTWIVAGNIAELNAKRTKKERDLEWSKNKVGEFIKNERLAQEDYIHPEVGVKQ